MTPGSQQPFLKTFAHAFTLYRDSVTKMNVVYFSANKGSHFAILRTTNLGLKFSLDSRGIKPLRVSFFKLKIQIKR